MKNNPKFPSYWEKGCNYLASKDKVMAEIIGNYHGEGLSRRNPAFYTLARSIIGQQISVKAADSIWNKFETALKNAAELTPESVMPAKAGILTNIAQLDTGLRRNDEAVNGADERKSLSKHISSKNLIKLSIE